MEIIQKVGFIGTGNMGQALIKALIESKTLNPNQIYATNRTPGKLKKIVDQFGIHSFSHNEELLDHVDIIFLCVKPQDFIEVFEALGSRVNENLIIVSVAAGVSFDQMRKLIPMNENLIRVMPNTPTQIQKGVLGYCTYKDSNTYKNLIETLLKPLGLVVEVSEGDSLEALTVACACGPGFIYEFMIYWKEWLEGYGFDSKIAEKMVFETFNGSCELIQKGGQTDFKILQQKVTSKEGVTASGLDSMRELELERILRLSFEKAVSKDKQINENLNKYFSKQRG